MKTSILRVFLLTVVLFITSMLVISDMALSNPLWRGSQFIAETTLTSQPSAEVLSQETANITPSEPSKAKVEVTESTQQSTQSKAGELTQKASQPQETPSESGGPYDMEAIKAFNRALYGS
ncbi:hypothetical protein [Microseira wollei]|uniref:Uncharacterized protein n=1 Tax=Microseira wollei NIES-4236 TaxID=2530354 RepID=A0AAV3XF21_9CYAN|nr:hypothetical protein [Microseira wollei]GET40078.1 hypothetical protein MiSe_48860 [Microseira wollei NIES-4236]